MDREQLIAHMRARIEKCRMLAKSTTDANTAQLLNQIADEGEADILALDSEPAEPVTIHLDPPAGI